MFKKNFQSFHFCPLFPVPSEVNAERQRNIGTYTQKYGKLTLSVSLSACKKLKYGI